MSTRDVHTIAARAAAVTPPRIKLPRYCQNLWMRLF
jgi:hypothetical protein